MVKALTCLWATTELQEPTSAIPEQDDVTSHVHLTTNSIVGAYHHPVPAGMGSKAEEHTYSLPLTCKATPFIYKRGCALSQETQLIQVHTSHSRFIRSTKFTSSQPQNR